MKKLIFTLIIGLTSFGFAKAQSGSVFGPGDKVLNVGVGLVGNTIYSGANYTNVIMPISASIDFHVAHRVFNDENCSTGLGAYVAYTGASEKIDYTAENNWIPGIVLNYKYTNYLFGARGTIHYQFLDNFDTYTGVMLGYSIVGVKEISNNSEYNVPLPKNRFISSIFLGVRYYFVDNFALLGEFGVGVSNVKVGLSFKF